MSTPTRMHPFIRLSWLDVCAELSRLEPVLDETDMRAYQQFYLNVAQALDKSLRKTYGALDVIPTALTFEDFVREFVNPELEAGGYFARELEKKP